MLRVPAGPGVRFDGGVNEGQAVTPAFDSMLAKLIAYGATRAEAALRLGDALAELVVLGVPNNIDYLARIMRNQEFLAGNLHTGFLTQEAANLAAPTISEGEETAVLLAAAFADSYFRRTAFEVPEPYGSIGFWRN